MEQETGQQAAALWPQCPRPSLTDFARTRARSPAINPWCRAVGTASVDWPARPAQRDRELGVCRLVVVIATCVLDQPWNSHARRQPVATTHRAPLARRGSEHLLRFLPDGGAVLFRSEIDGVGEMLR